MSQDCLFKWLLSDFIDSFEFFIFFEAANFEKINQDYYKIIYKPITYDEIQTFSFRKLKNLTKAIGILMT